MAISVTGPHNPISPVPGHEAHVSFRCAKKSDRLDEAWNKSQVRNTTWCKTTILPCILHSLWAQLFGYSANSSNYKFTQLDCFLRKTSVRYYFSVTTITACNKQIYLLQIYVYDFGEDGRPLEYPNNILPEYVIEVEVSWEATEL